MTLSRSSRSRSASCRSAVSVCCLARLASSAFSRRSWSTHRRADSSSDLSWPAVAVGTSPAAVASPPPPPPDPVCTRQGTGSLGHWVNGSFGSSFTSGSPGHRVIILTRRDTRVFPVFEKMPKMQNVHLKC